MRMIYELSRTLHHIGCSGGKDSTALILWAIHESGLPRESLRISFCDTGNEDRLTYEHLDYLRREVVEPAGIVDGLETLKPKRDFFQLAFHKRRFPSRKAQFCTHELKINPTRDWLKARWDEGFDVVMLNGKRMGESAQRKAAMAGKPERAFSDHWGCEEWAPLMHWTIQDVLAIHKRHGVRLNPLYHMGAKRVGCWPCINCGKAEIRLVAKHRVEKIAAIMEAERAMESRYGRYSSFFPNRGEKDKRAQRFGSKMFVEKKDDGTLSEYPVCTIEDVVRWAHTERGGKVKRVGNGEHEDAGLGLDLDDKEPRACWMDYGACE